MIRFGLARVTCIVALLATFAAADDGNTVRSIRIYPPSIRLDHDADRQSFIVLAAFADGSTRDVTATATIALGDPAIATRTDNVVRARGNGRTELIAEFAGSRARAPLEANTVPPRPVDFAHDVVPIFTKAGCNAGGCHGAARGKDGFHLSLFGYDPDGDHHRLTRELAGRRVNVAAPANSLLIEKAVARIDHTGGKCVEPESSAYETIVRWIERGAPAPARDAPHIAALRVDPPEAVLVGERATQRLVVTARYDDGSDRDVTHLAVFRSNEPHTASVDAAGLVTGGKRGEAFVTAQFGTHTAGASLLVLPEDVAFAWPDEPAGTWIDTRVNEKLRKLRIAPARLAADATFLRRATLDLAGRLPTEAECAAFAADARPDKRARLVDRLLDGDGFVDLWTLKWAELLQIRTTGDTISYKATLGYHRWLRSHIAKNTPIDRWVRELLTATGSTLEDPPANYYRIERDPKKLAENAAQVFFGMRIQCAQCHNHPFDRWTMNDYYGFAGFFAQVGVKRAEDPRGWIVYGRSNGEVPHPVTKRPVAPTFLGGAAPDTKRKDRRAIVATWVTSPENPYFARHVANFVWAHFFGRGIVEPVDDVRVTNPPINAALLDALADRLREHAFDVRALIREICASRAYQRSSVPHADQPRATDYFAQARVRRIRAEVLLDCIGQVTDSRARFRRVPGDARAVEIVDGSYSTHFLTVFGRPERKTVCTCEVKMEPSLSQALHLINGDTVTENIRRGRLVPTLRKRGLTTEAIVDAIYRRTLARAPKPDEWRAIAAAIKGADNADRAIEDVFWALLNAKEFLFNH